MPRRPDNGPNPGAPEAYGEHGVNLDAFIEVYGLETEYVHLGDAFRQIVFQIDTLYRNWQQVRADNANQTEQIVNQFSRLLALITNPESPQQDQNNPTRISVQFKQIERLVDRFGRPQGTKNFSIARDTYDLLVTKRVEYLERQISEFNARIIRAQTGNDNGEVLTADQLNNWDDDRPQSRQDWKPHDYILHAMASIQPPDRAEIESGVLARNEFNKLIARHPEYQNHQGWFKVAMANWQVLFEADPPSGSNGFTVDIGAFFEKNFQQKGFDTTHVHEVMRHKDYGNVAMRIAALIELCLYDAGEEDNFEYVIRDENGEITETVVKKGQFVARQMDGNEDDLLAAIKKIVKNEGWADRIKDDYFIEDAVFRIVTALDMRGHFFLDDTASAVTKGFGGADYTWMSKPQATVGYDQNRYAREPKASWFLLAGATAPREWHEKAAYNQFFKPTGEVKTGEDQFAALVKLINSLKKSNKNRPEVNALIDNRQQVLNLLNNYSRNRRDELEAVCRVLVQYVADAREKAMHEKEHHIEDWMRLFVSEKDHERIMSKVYDLVPGGRNNPKHPRPIRERINNRGEKEFDFTPLGPTFPTVYEFFMSQYAQKVKPKNGLVVAAGLQQGEIFDDEAWAEYTKLFRDPKNKNENIFQMYLVARGGWLQVLDMIKEPVKELGTEALLKKIDTFTGAIGKSKIVDGAHHNMMNMMAYLFLIKTFKYLKPRTYSEFRRARRLALMKVADQETSQSGGGIPAHVKEFMTWILDEAKSTQRGEDKPGDLLRPMDPSVEDIISQEIEEETHGMDEGIWKWLRKAAITAEQNLATMGEQDENEKGKNKEIPHGPIKWEEQETTTKK